MKLATTTVSREGYADEKWNSKRLSIAERALAKAKELGADVLVLPAGFLAARTSKARDSLATSLINIATRQNIAVVFGIDQDVKNLSKDFRPEIRKGTLPFYAYAWSATDQGSPCAWNQRSIDGDNQRDASEARCREVPLLRIKDETVAVLICGGIFNRRVREALSTFNPRPKVVVDIAHDGLRFRVWQGMKALAALGLASVCSVHVQREYAVYCYVPPANAMSSSSRDSYVYGPPRIELKL